MGQNDPLPQKQRRVNRSIDFRVLTPDEAALYLPGLVFRYTQVAGEEASQDIAKLLQHSEIYLFSREAAVIGFVAFTYIGMRYAAHMEMTFWGPSSHVERAKAVRDACLHVMAAYDLRRVEAFIDNERDDLLNFAGECGGEFIGTIPNAWMKSDGTMAPVAFFVLTP